MRHIAGTTLIISIFLFFIGSALARPPYDESVRQPVTSRLYDPEVPVREYAAHNVGQIDMMITNFGIFGKGTDEPMVDPFSGQTMPSLKYPDNTVVNYLWQMQLWIGAIVGKDTLVSVAGWGAWDRSSEFWPDTLPNSHIEMRSTNDRSSSEFAGAVSQQDFITYYMDTLDRRDLTGYDLPTGRVHRPIGLKVTQRSYSWGYDYADDFILFDLEVANITFRDIEDMYIGIYVDNDILQGNRGSTYDDIVGFQDVFRSLYIAGLQDTLNIGWTADNDGDPNPITGSYQGINSPTAAAGLVILRTPHDKPKTTFNWWVYDYYPYLNWGPTKQPPPGYAVRTFGGHLGYPRSDADKYYLMSNGEIDYNYNEAGWDHSYDGWLSPPDDVNLLNNGSDVHYVISSGPFDLEPGYFAPFTFAVVMGQHYHRDQFTPGRTHNLDYLGLNALWANWIFDNPGADSVGNVYRGKYHVYEIGRRIVEIDTLILAGETIIDTTFEYARIDTLFYAGDGTPDFKGAAPPPAPEFELHPRINEYNEGMIDVRWNGLNTETELDQFSQMIDFEGYRVYISETGHDNGYTMLSSYDVENYDRWEYNEIYDYWDILQPPFTLVQLKQLYGENFDPENYNSQDKLFAKWNYSTQEYDSYYFTRHDWNQSDLTDTTAIYKLYPYEPYPPTTEIDSAQMYWPEVLTPEGRFKYFEYRFIIRRLLPSKSYYIAVTAFDQGDPSKGLSPIETNPVVNGKREFALNSTDLVIEKGLNVIVYPNPYLINGGYQGRFEGWEDDEQNLPTEFTRALNFMNLPPKCTIRIFTIDGDLVDQIEHDCHNGDSGCMHEKWDMISRNRMAIMSGIYYYSVESEYGSQIGKFVVVK